MSMIIPYGLTCHRVETPLGIPGKPMFSWKLRSEERNQVQRAYQLRCASVKEGLSHPDIYDSGKVFSQETLDITWPLEVLASFQRIWWNVTVWDREDVPVTSESTWFEAGVSPEKWHGITVYAGDTPELPYAKTSFATTAPALDMPVMPFTPEAEASIQSDAPPPDDELPKVMRGKQDKQETYFRKEFTCPAIPIRARLYLAASGACIRPMILPIW